MLKITEENETTAPILKSVFIITIFGSISKIIGKVQFVLIVADDIRAKLIKSSLTAVLQTAYDLGRRAA